MSVVPGVMDLLKQAKQLSGAYENIVLAQVNDDIVRISLMTEPYYWHMHPDSDETFIGLEGTLLVELENQMIELRAWQMFTVPRGVQHRTAPAGLRSVNLTIERANATTIRMEDLTAPAVKNPA